jgi:hypothetical protein
MPVRKRIGRVKRLNDRLTTTLLEHIRLGLPWHVDNKFRTNTGLNELRGLITGYFFFCELCEEDGDLDTKKTLYELVRDEFLAAHVHYRPGERPWAWWGFDAPEPRRIVGWVCDEDDHDDDCDGSHYAVDGRDLLPAADDPDLPQWAKGMWFGCPVTFDGHRYEDEYDYLSRLNLLLPEEKAIFEKYGCIINVNIQSGERGKCPQCWERAQRVAREIGFDLDAATQRYEFWIPGDLYFPCEHSPVNPHGNENDGIFEDAD